MYSTLTFPQKIAFLISMLLLLSGSTLWYVSSEKAQEAEQVKAQADSVSQQVNRLLQQVKRQVEPTDLAKLGRRIPTEWEMPLFIADLTMAAKDSQVTLVRVVPGNPDDQQSNNNGQSNSHSSTQQPGQPNDGNSVNFTSPPPELASVHSLEVSLTAEGEADKLVQFADRLQQMPRLVWVNDYSLCDCNEGSTSTTSSSPPWKLDLKLTLYAHAPWDAKSVGSVKLPFAIPPANNEQAFGRK